MFPPFSFGLQEKARPPLCGAALAWETWRGGGVPVQHDEVWGKERIRLTERCYLPQSERRGPASASASRGMSTTCDPAAHGAT